MKKFFNKIVLFIKTLFTGLDKWIHQHVQPSIETLERLKKLVDMPIVNTIVLLTPTGLDDRLLAFAQVYLVKAIDALHVTADIVNEPDYALKIIKLAEYLKTVSPQMRKAIYFKLASETAKQSAGKAEFKGHGVDLLTQMQYSKLKENATAETLPTEMLYDGELQTLETEQNGLR